MRIIAICPEAHVGDAIRTQARVVVYDPASGDRGPQASAGAILILPGDPMAMAAAAGLVRIEGDT